MLHLLSPDQAEKDWKSLSSIIIQSFSHDEGSVPNKLELLSMVLQGRLQVWVSHREGEEKIRGVLTTCFIPDYPHQTRSMLIYSLFAVQKDGAREEWEDGMKQLKDYALRNGASGIIFYTLNPSVDYFAGRLGAVKKNFYRLEVVNG